MNEPRRLTEDGFDIEQRLLRAGALELPSRQAERQAASALGIAGFGVTSAAAGATKGLLLAKVLGVVALGGAVSGGAWWLSQRSEPAETRPAETVASGPSAARAAPALGVTAKAPSLDAARPARAASSSRPEQSTAGPPHETRAPASNPRAARAAGVRRTARSTQPEAAAAVRSPASKATATAAPVGSAENAAAASARPEPSAVSSSGAARLREEVALMDRARRALAAGDAAGALVVLDQHQRSFPNGTLGQEAKLLRIEALARRGDRAAARALGQRFLSEHPDTPHRKRIESRLAQ